MAEATTEVLFPTFVSQIQWEKTDRLNECLRAELDKLRVYDPEGIYRSNSGGTWHSKDVVLTQCGPAGKELEQMFRQMFATMAMNLGAPEDHVFAFKMAAWAMRYADHGYAAVHNHPNCHFSGVYYVDDGADAEAEPIQLATGVKVKPGTLEFVDLRGINTQVKGLSMQPSARYTPKAGRMIVFPSWLPHYVHPFRGREGVERISIACNATLMDTKPTEKAHDSHK